jgi:hypothetical protein
MFFDGVCIQVPIGIGMCSDLIDEGSGVFGEEALRRNPFQLTAGERTQPRLVGGRPIPFPPNPHRVGGTTGCPFRTGDRERRMLRWSAARIKDEGPVE